MERLKTLIENIDSLKSELDSLLPLKRTNEDRLWEKFRLEWNFNSNHIEGNTLSYNETYLLLIKGDIVGEHKAQEIDEMRAHDLVVSKVREYSLDKSRQLTEADIREWNRIILVRPYWKEARTLDGQRTQKLIEPGNYKSTPNSVLLPNNEVFHYASPEDTPILMQELIEWYRKVDSEKSLHPVEIAALLHYKLVRIHPFDDSNGRTSRMLMNYHLLKMGLPPIIIKSDDKKNYLFALSKADAGSLNSFVEYISEQLVWSLELSIKAAKGEDIREKGDVYKEIEIWKKGISNSIKKEPTKSIELMRELFKSSLAPLFTSLIQKNVSHFSDLFVFNRINVYTDGGGIQLKENDYVHDLGSFFKGVFENYENLNQFNAESKSNWSISFFHNVLRTRIDNEFYINSELKIEFYPLRYEISFRKDEILKKNSYATQLTNEDIDQIVDSCISAIFKEIQKFQ